MNSLRKYALSLILFVTVSIFMFNCGVLADVDITASATSGAAPLTVNFTSDTSGYVGVINYYWDFDDGEISHENDPTHTFVNPGIYSVTCEATNGETVVTASIEIEVTAP